MLRQIVILLVLGASGLVPAAAAEPQVPAFPGAEGFGASARGGRGGTVVHVTNLNEAGPGSFRAALAEKGPRIIVFDVGGTLELHQDLLMPNDNGRVTIAGQTAPGGITIIGGSLGVPGWSRAGHGTPDVIARHLRVRGVHNTTVPGQGGDTLSSYWAQRVIFDHCSVCGSCDESVDVIHTTDFTMQWCTIEEPALWGQGGNQHDEGDHNFGLISSYAPAARISCHHNLFAHCANRCPMVIFGPADIRNNVVYNFGIGFTGPSRQQLAEENRDFSLVGNYYRCGPAPRPYVSPIYAMGAGRFFCHDNFLDLRDNAQTTINHPWRDLPEANKRFRGVSFFGGGEPLDQPAPMPPVTTQPAAEAYRLVLAQAGAWPRDATTRRIVREVQTRTGIYGLSGPYEHFAERRDGPTSPRFDTDRDGMPDAWEKEHRLDPADPTDGNRIVPRGQSPQDRHAGYTYVEYYLNELADQIVGVDGPLCKVAVTVNGPGLVVCEHGGRTPGWRIDLSRMSQSPDAASDGQGIPESSKGPEIASKKRGSAFRERARRSGMGYEGNPVEVLWGEMNVFSRGSTVVLRALPQTSPGVGAPATSRFSHWSGGPIDGLAQPQCRLVIDRDMALVARFQPLP